MNMLKHGNKFKPFFVATLLATSVALVGCNDDNDDDIYTPIVTPSYQHYVSQKPYTGGTVPEFAKNIDVVTYNMPYVTGKTEKATAMILMPKIAKPADGWRVVVWVHGTTGVGDACAPSNTPLGTNFSILAKSLLEQGYVIVAPDYEGLGTPGIHPYLNLKSEAESAIYAMKAVKEKFGSDLNGAWMSAGQSQGGHASLGVAQFAATDASYKGAVATAPASSLGYIITQIAPAAIANIETMSKPIAVSIYSELLSYAAYTAAGVRAYDPTFSYGVMFQPRALELAKNAEGTTGDNGLCLGDMMSKYSQDITAFLAEDPTRKVMDYPAFVKDFEKNSVISKFLIDSQPGTQKLTKPVYVVQGKDDTAVPYQVTQNLVAQLNAMGSTPAVKLDVVEGAGHTQAIVVKNEQVVDFIKTNMPPKQ